MHRISSAMSKIAQCNNQNYALKALSFCGSEEVRTANIPGRGGALQGELISVSSGSLPT